MFTINYVGILDSGVDVGPTALCLLVLDFFQALLPY